LKSLRKSTPRPLIENQQRHDLTPGQRAACATLAAIGLAAAIVRLAPARPAATPPGGGPARTLSAPLSDPMQPFQGPEVVR
jgi:hypothetical protein